MIHIYIQVCSPQMMQWLNRVRYPDSFSLAALPSSMCSFHHMVQNDCPAPAIASAFQPVGKRKMKGSTPSLPSHWLGPSHKPHLMAREAGKCSPWWRVLYPIKTFITIKEENRYKGTLWSQPQETNDQPQDILSVDLLS